MTHHLKSSLLRLLAVELGVAVFCSSAAGVAQSPVLQPRITAKIDNSRRVSLVGSTSPKARVANDTGSVAPDMQLQGMTVVFNRTPAQQSALDALVADQQNPASPLYHHWLTPEQYAAQFGMADSDIATVKTWLEQQGFTVNYVSRSRTRIYFSGTSAEVASAFGAPLHYYKAAGEAVSHFAPSEELSVPAALASVVRNVGNLSSFRPHSRVRVKQPVLKPLFTVEGTKAYFLTPLDVATIYNVKQEYQQGYTGSGQTIAIVGQSAVSATDLANFRSALGLAANPPSLNLIANTGTSQTYTGDEFESDLDLEYSGAMAPEATVAFYYVGNSPNYGALNALEYVIDNDSAPIISTSYGVCEFDAGIGAISALDLVLEEGVSQGQTIIAASGDNGSQDCSGDTNLTTAEQQVLAVDYPASSPYVLGVGGTEFPVADVTPTNTTYWTSASSSADLIGSAKSYIPEQAWNDDVAANELDAGGGGASLMEPRPTWQAGVTGIPSGTQRLVPDISLAASPNDPGYLICSSDTTFTGVTGSCTDGFRNSSSSSFQYDVAGGTSFAAPIFAGLLAVINQADGDTTGQGLINPILYTLASNPATYASAFHDITSGGNECLLSATSCGTGSQTSSYLAGVGYDETSGLGSVNFANLVASWSSAKAASAAATTTILVVDSPLSITAGSTVNLEATVSSGTTPVTSGTVTFMEDGTSIGTAPLNSSGVAIFSVSTLPVGADALTASYGGASKFDASVSGAVGVTVTATTTATATTLTASPASVAAGASVNLSAAVTSNGSPVTSGVVAFLVDGSSVGIGMLNSSGTASMSLDTLPVGTDSISASYGGTSSFAPSTSASVSVTVTGTSTPVTISVGSVSSLFPGEGTSSTLKISAGSSYSGTMNLTCTLTNSPVGAQYLPTCSLNPTTITVAANATASSTLMVQTTSPTSTALARPTGLTPWGLGGASAMAGLLMFCVPTRRRRMTSLLALLLVVCSFGAVGCGSGNANHVTTSTPSTTAGSYTFTVRGTDVTNPSTTASTTVTITVN